jgi:5-methylcytosine-specific restriction endonuclease McrA
MTKRKKNWHRRRGLPGLLTTLAVRYGWICNYCGCSLTIHTATYDHVVPLCRGGNDSEENMVLACGFCNKAKSFLPAHQFLDWLDWVRSGRSFSPIKSQWMLLEQEEHLELKVRAALHTSSTL